MVLSIAFNIDASNDKRLAEIPMGDTYKQLHQDRFESARQAGGEAAQVVPNQNQLSSKAVLMNGDDEALITTVRERLVAPQRVKVSLDDL